MDKLSVMRELLAQLSKDAKGRVAGRLKSKYSPPPGAELRSGSEVPQAPEAAPGDGDGAGNAESGESKLEELLALLGE
jgi:hypothetical protein